MAYLTKVFYNGDGVNTNFIVPFNYIHKSYVKVKINEVETSNFTWLNNNTIQITPAPLGDVKIYRETPKNTNLVSFNDVSLLKKEVLETSNKQLLYILQEIFDDLVILDEKTTSVFYNKVYLNNISLNTTYVNTIFEEGSHIILYNLQIISNGIYDFIISIDEIPIFSAINVNGNYYFNECLSYSLDNISAPVRIKFINKNPDQASQNISIKMLYSVG